MTGQEFENHIIFEKLEQFKNRISDNEIRESIGIEDINFFETAYGYFLDRLRLTIPVIVQETELTTISQEVESSLSQINTFIGNKNYGHITNAKNNLYSAITRVRNLPLPFSKNDFNFSKNISTFEKIVQEKYNNLEKENKELKQTLEELNNEIKSNKTELKRIKSSLEQKEIEIQNINSTFQTDFANIKATANQNYDSDRKAFRTEFDSLKQNKEHLTDNEKLITHLATTMTELDATNQAVVKRVEENVKKSLKKKTKKVTQTDSTQKRHIGSVKKS